MKDTKKESRWLKRDPSNEKRVRELIQKACDFYGVSEEHLKEWNHKGNGISNVRTFILCKLVNYYGYTITEAGRVLNTEAWGVTMSLKRLEINPDLMLEFLNVFGKEEE